MNPTTYPLLISTLSTSTIITMSSHHWLLAWLGLEINTLAMVPIIAKPHHPRATEAATKYFLVQAAAAAMILFASITNTWQTGQWTITQPTTDTTAVLLTLALTMKLGLAPMHFWYPEVIQGTTLNTALILSTWQKLAPFTLLYLTTNHLSPSTLLMISLLSTLVGGWMGLNQTQTRKMMAFSSIAHMGWLTAALALNQNLSLLTITVYITLTTTMFSMLALTTTKTLTDLNTMNSHTPVTTALMMLILMSLGGMPPLTGFMPKWLILKELNYHSLPLLATALALASLPSLFFYTRMAYLTTLTTPPTTTPTKHAWRFKTPPVPPLPTITMMTMLALPITSLMQHS
uniref:NADH-ubiquinone oxidoreductase chain 2 n=1 Tax=Quedenfeldtia trachyblepharus TaxID=460631 RepID=A0A343J8I3_9SAUR|nr:NADH dehydrogenase subunit 2 [Quedenfeldtia trachyblepharus]